MSISFLALTLLFALGAGAAAGIGLALRSRGRWRLVGALVAGQALLFLALQVILSSIPVAGLEPSIAAPIGPLLLQAGTTLLAIGSAVGLAWLTVIGLRRLAARRRGPALALALASVPALGLAGLAALWQLSTPERVRERDPERRTISVPEGFRAGVYLRGTIDNPTSIAFGPAGELFIGDIGGSLWVARDGDGDGVSDQIERLDEGYAFLTGLAWHQGELYVASQGKVEALRDSDGDGAFESRRTVVDGLPSMIYIPHTNNGISFGPDGRLYFGVGSTSGGDTESNELAAAILSVNPDGSDLKVFARGLSNSFDVAFNAAGDMFAGDNQPTDEASGGAGDELNHIVEGGHYGYPYYYGDAPEPGSTRAPIATFPAHSSPNGAIFYNGGAFPGEYRDNMFIALWGTGEIYRVELGKSSAGAYLSRSSSFAAGFVYPLDVTAGPDGSLYVADFGASAIYRISYQG